MSYSFPVNRLNCEIQRLEHFAACGPSFTEKAEKALENLEKEHFYEKQNRTLMLTIGALALSILAAFAAEFTTCAALSIVASVIFLGFHKGYDETATVLKYRLNQETEQVESEFNQMKALVSDQYDQKRKFVGDNYRRSSSTSEELENMRATAEKWDNQNDAHKRIAAAVIQIVTTSRRPAVAGDAWRLFISECKFFVYGISGRADSPYHVAME